MFSQTRTALEQFDNQHDFERMAADILNALGYTEVVPLAPRGGSDGGRDITFNTENGGKGLACVTLRDDIQRKFEEDFCQRKAGEYEKYVLFCTAYLTASRKIQFTKYCLEKLQSLFVPYDIEALRSLLDSSLKSIRKTYLHIKDDSKAVSEEDLQERSEEEKKLAVWNILKDELLSIKKNAGSVYNFLWQHYSISQVEQEVRDKLTAITETSGALQEYREVAQAITDFTHYAYVVTEKKKRHEFSGVEDKNATDKELTNRYNTLLRACNKLIE